MLILSCTSLITLAQFAVPTLMFLLTEVFRNIKQKEIKALSCLSLVVGIYLHLCKWDKKLASLGCGHNCCEL